MGAESGPHGPLTVGARGPALVVAERVGGLVFEDHDDVVVAVKVAVEHRGVDGGEAAVEEFFGFREGLPVGGVGGPDAETFGGCGCGRVEVAGPDDEPVFGLLVPVGFGRPGVLDVGEGGHDLDAALRRPVEEVVGVGDADGVAVPGPGEDHAEVAAVRSARDVDVAHDLAGLVGLEPGLAVVERGEGVAVAAEGEVDALVAGLFEVGEDDGRGGGGGLGVSERSEARGRRRGCAELVERCSSDSVSSVGCAMPVETEILRLRHRMTAKVAGMTAVRISRRRIERASLVAVGFGEVVGVGAFVGGGVGDVGVEEGFVAPVAGCGEVAGGVVVLPGPGAVGVVRLQPDEGAVFALVAFFAESCRRCGS